MKREHEKITQLIESSQAPVDYDLFGGSEEEIHDESSEMQEHSRTAFSTSNAAHCGLVFDQREINIPTCLIVLPYKLKWDRDRNMVVVPSDSHAEIAIEFGRHLLQINKATARLSFWLQMKTNLSYDSSFKRELKQWLKRARTEPVEAVARDVLEGLSLSEQYMDVCREVLEEDNEISYAKAYIADPERAAQTEIQHSIEVLIQFYKLEGNQFFYLIDESRQIPVSYDGKSRSASYPLSIQESSEVFEGVLFPLMNISVMSVIASSGLDGFAKMLGLAGVPPAWKESSIGLIHGKQCPHSVTQFASLQKQLREQPVDSASTMDSDVPSPSPRGLFVGQELSPLEGLKRIYQQHDSSECFSGLKKSALGHSEIWVAEVHRKLFVRSQSVTKPKQTKSPDSRENYKDNMVKQKWKFYDTASKRTSVTAATASTTSSMASSVTKKDPFIGKTVEIRHNETGKKTLKFLKWKHLNIS